MTPMLEKIARAIAEVDAVAPGDAHGVFDIDPDLYRSLARAALLAMRDLDDATKQRGSEIYCKGKSGLFACMIDAILAQPSTPTDVTPA